MSVLVTGPTSDIRFNDYNISQNCYTNIIHYFVLMNNLLLIQNYSTDQNLNFLGLVFIQNVESILIIVQLNIKYQIHVYCLKYNIIIIYSFKSLLTINVIYIRYLFKIEISKLNIFPFSENPNNNVYIDTIDKYIFRLSILILIKSLIKLQINLFKRYVIEIIYYIK